VQAALTFAGQPAMSGADEMEIRIWPKRVVLLPDNCAP